MRYLGLLTLMFAASSCTLLHPVAKQPCAGLYCVGVGVEGAPGYVLACYETAAEAQVRLQAERSQGRKAELK